ncbi:MAG: energy transducer TonB [Bacteroidetes bacterium]|nr:MAG: energy transducer TonB [Bacteroidota bacterium]
MRKTTAFLMVLCLAHTLSAQLFEPENIQTRAEQMPYFPGCEPFNDAPEAKRQCSNNNLIRFVSTHLVYPETARAQSVEGTVYVSFVVDKDGSVLSPKVLKDIGGGCGEAALDVIREMPKWEPALEKGQPVAVRLNLPIQFALKRTDGEDAERFTISWGLLKGNTVRSESLLSALTYPVSVRDPFGETRLVNELVFAFEKKKRVISARDEKGQISEPLKRIVRRAKKGGRFTISASIQDQGKMIWVSRTFLVTD